MNEPETRGSRSFVELAKYALIAVILVVPFRVFIAQPFVVSGSSMEPTFHDGEYLIVDQISYRFEAPKRGSVLIFRYPNDPGEFFIKRVIGLPNETIDIAEGKVTITNDEHPNGMTLSDDYVVFEKHDYGHYTLGSKEYFVMGDNRSGSSDSRIWGALDEKYIVGRPFVRLLPVTRVELYPGDYESTQ